MTDAEEPRFLDAFPPRQRPGIAGEFYGAIRSGRAAQDPQAVCETVLERVDGRAAGPWPRYWPNVAAELRRNRDLAVAYAAQCIRREGLSKAEKDRLKAERRRLGMQRYPPTERQLAYLERLGHAGDPPANCWEAHEAIARLAAKLGGQRLEEDNP